MRTVGLLLVSVACSPNEGDGSHPGGHGTDPTPTDSATDSGATTATVPSLAVTCDPTDNALRFRCTVTVDPPQPVQLTFVRADGRSPARTVDGPGDLGLHELPLYFLAPEQGYDVTVVPTARPDDAVTTSLTTGAAPPEVDSWLVTTGTSTMGLLGTQLPCSADATGVVYDTQTGDLVWYQLFEPGGKFGATDMLTFTADHTVLGESLGSVIELDLMGADLVRLEDLATDFGVPSGGMFGNFHHDIAKHDGVYYVLYQEPFGGADKLDGLILFDGTGTELGRWHAEDHLAIPSGWSGDFLHTNAIDVDSAGDIYLSFQGQNTVAKLDGDLASPTFGEPYWLLAGKAGGDLVGTLTADFGAVAAPSAFSDEHSLILRPDGRIQLLDNTDGRALVISVDEAAGTATADAEFATLEKHCSYQGTSRSTRAGNPVVGCLGDTVREYDLATEALLWEGTVNCASGHAPGSSRFYPLDGW